MKESVDEKGNLIFEINSKKIVINISRLRCLMGPGILSVSGRIESLSDRISDDGVTLRKENKKEGSIYLNLKRIVNPKNRNSVIQRRIIENLSHEVRHIFQPESKNKLLKFSRKLNIALFLPLAIICVLNVIAVMILRRAEIRTPIYLDILSVFFPTFLLFLQISYLLDPEERDARKFSQKAVRDKKWLEIVQVKSIK